MTEEERRSLTRSDLLLTDEEWRTFGDAVDALNGVRIPYALSGLFSVYVYTGISRRTDDLDLLLEPRHVVATARALAEAGFRPILEERHWLAKAERDGHVVDLVFGMGNGLCLIDDAWHRRGRTATLYGRPVVVAAPEDLIFHRLFINERHRFDMSDIVHLVLVFGEELDWTWLLERVGEHWRLLFAQILFFDFSYPGQRHRVPEWVRRELRRRWSGTGKAPGDDDGAAAGGSLDAVAEDACSGTLISRFSFSVDVHDWGFRDRRAEYVEAARSLAIVREIAESDVWAVRREDGAATPPADVDREET